MILLLSRCLLCFPCISLLSSWQRLLYFSSRCIRTPYRNQSVLKFTRAGQWLDLDILYTYIILQEHYSYLLGSLCTGFITWHAKVLCVLCTRSRLQRVIGHHGACMHAAAGVVLHGTVCTCYSSCQSEFSPHARAHPYRT